MESSKNQISTLIASVFIASVLFFQFIIIPAKIFEKPLSGRYWPITDYPMYSGSHFEGDVVDVYYPMHVIYKDGRRVEYNPEKMHLELFHYERIMQLMRNNEARVPAMIPIVLSSIEDPDDAVRIEIYTYPLKLAREGAIATESKLVKSIDVENYRVGERNAT